MKLSRYLFCAFLLNISGPQWDSRAAVTHPLFSLKEKKNNKTRRGTEEEKPTRRQTRNEDGAGPSADDLFTNYVVVFSPTVSGDGRHTRRLPGGLYGDSSRLSKRKEHFDVHSTTVRVLFNLIFTFF